MSRGARTAMPPGRVVISSIVRHAVPGEPSAFLRVLDLAGGRVLLTAAVPESSARPNDPNPRGGARGARGVSVHGGRLVVSNAERLFVLDAAWQPQQTMTHPLLAGIHDILAEENGILVTCANCDTLARIGWSGALEDRWCVREEPVLVRELALRLLPALDPEADYRDLSVMHRGVHNSVHVNGVTRGRDGLLLSFGRILPTRQVVQRRIRAAAGRALGKVGVRPPAPRSSRGDAVGRIPGSRAAIVLLRDGASPSIVHLERGLSVPNHNVAEAGDALLFNDSSGNQLVMVGRRDGMVQAVASIPGAPAFARGLARVGDSLWLVGSQAPCAVHAVDLEARAVVASFELAGSEHETVYGICPLPDTFDDPPAVVAWGDA